MMSTVYDVHVAGREARRDPNKSGKVEMDEDEGGGGGGGGAGWKRWLYIKVIDGACYGKRRCQGSRQIVRGGGDYVYSAGGEFDRKERGETM